MATAKTTKKPAAKKTPAKRKAAAKHVTHSTHVAAVAPVTKPARTTKRTYIFAVGRRKQAIARVRWHLGVAPAVTINGRAFDHYFPLADQQQLVRAPLILTHQEKEGAVTVKVAGGGSAGQADAVRLGIARALVKMDPDLRVPLKRAGFLRRDPRVKERKKYGLKRARRAPQWQKR